VGAEHETFYASPPACLVATRCGVTVAGQSAFNLSRNTARSFSTFGPMTARQYG
jgi:hypothetical protein